MPFVVLLGRFGDSGSRYSKVNSSSFDGAVGCVRLLVPPIFGLNQVLLQDFAFCWVHGDVLQPGGQLLLCKLRDRVVDKPLISGGVGLDHQECSWVKGGFLRWWLTSKGGFNRAGACWS